MNNNDELTYHLSQWDQFQWEDYLDNHSEALLAVEVGKEKIYSFPTFASEVFHRLYALSPKPLEHPKPEAKWAIDAHNSLSEMSEFEELQTRIEIEAVGNSFKKWELAGIGASKFARAIAQSIPKPTSNLTNPQTLRQQIIAAKQRLQKVKEQQAESPEPEKFEEQIADLESLIAQITTEGKKAVLECQKYAAFLELKREDIISNALQSALKAVSDVSNALNAFGWGDETGTAGKGGSLTDKIQLAKRVSDQEKLINIAKIAGRMKLIATQKQRSKTQEYATEIYSVETGNDLSRILPSELVKLAIPCLRPLFASYYCERNLLQYACASQEKLGRGPLVICLDSSGSMSGFREEWSKGVAIALLTIAQKQKRTCRILHFTADIERVDDFPKGVFTPQKLIASMEAFYGGGTCWDKALNSALQIIEQEKEFKQADIILITDGDCDVDDHWLQEFKAKQKQLEFSTFGVLIGNNNTTRLGEILDKVITISNLNDDGDVDAIFTL